MRRQLSGFWMVLYLLLSNAMALGVIGCFRGQGLRFVESFST
jgi:hypothetical protein